MVEWQPLYQLDIQVIDNQHQEIFNLIREIEAVLNVEPTKYKRDNLAPLIEAYKEQAMRHFDTEEAIMEEMNYLEMNYSEMINHIREHEAILNHIESVNIDMISSIISLVNFLKETMNAHMFNYDYKMSRYYHIYYEISC